MKTKKPTFKVTKTTGLPNKTKKFNKMVDDLSGASRFADKDFDFKKFPSQKNLDTAFEKALKDIGEVPLTATAIYKTSLFDFKPTALPYEIEGEPAINCDKWMFMCLLLGIGLALLATSHGDFLALWWGLKH